MKALIVALMLCIAACILIAGCTTPTVPTTPTPTATVTTPMPTIATPVPVTDPELLGDWTLSELASQGGQAILSVFTEPITITFFDQGTFTGYGGCNNYQGSYTLPGTIGPNGKQITMGPIISTLKYCIGTSDTETLYLQILSNVTAYGIDNSTKLSMRDPVGNTLVFVR